MAAGVPLNEFDPLAMADTVIAMRNGSAGQIPIARLAQQMSVDIIVVNKQTRADLYADLAWAAGTRGAVWNDATEAWRGVYLKAGASGAGSWAKISDLPQTALTTAQLAAKADKAAAEAADALGDTLRLTNVGGTGNAVTAEVPTAQAHVARAVGQTVEWQQPADNTGDAALTVDGVTYGLRTRGGDVLPAGALAEAVRYRGVIHAVGGSPRIRVMQALVPTDIGAATAAQGALADSAVQPGALAVETSARQSADALGDTLRLTNVGGTGNAVTGDVPAAQAHIVRAVGQTVEWQQPATSGGDATLTVDDVTYGLRTRGGNILPAGALVEAVRYRGVIHATGGSPRIRVMQAVVPADIGAATAAQGALADSAVQPGDLGELAGLDEVTAGEIADGAVALVKMADRTAGTVIGRKPGGGDGRPEEMDAADLRGLLNVAAGATANDTDANLRNRATHTGAQAISTVTGLQSALDGKASAAQGALADSAVQPGDAVSDLAETADAKLMTGAERAKLAGVAAGATANAADAALRDRSTHTGAQAISTVTGLQTALDGKASAAQGALAETAVQPDALTAALAPKAPLASPALTGVPTVPTAAPGTATGQIASTAFVGAATAAEAAARTAAIDAAAAAEAEARAAQWRAVVGSAASRPGDAPEGFAHLTTGLPEALTPIDPADAMTTQDGRVLRITGPAKLSRRGWWRVDPGQVQTVLCAYRVAQHSDPAGATVRVRIAWLDRYGAAVSAATDIDSRVVTTDSGRIAVMATVAAAPGTGITVVAPAGAVHARAYLETYETGGLTDVEVLTDMLATGALTAPDVSALTARVTAIEGETLPARVTALESAVSAPLTSRLATRAAAIAAAIPAPVEIVWLERYATGAPYAPAPYRRVGAAQTGSFQSGAQHWAPAWYETQLEYFGAIGDGAANDQAAWALARSLGLPIFLTGTYLVTDPANTLGVTMRGPGEIVTAVPGGRVQHNTARPRVPVSNRHFLSVVKDLWIADGNAKIAITGNSTATDGYGLGIGTFVSRTLRQMGLGVASCVNAAVGGTSWASVDLAAQLTAWSEQKDFLILKYDGINMAGTAPTTIEEAVVALRNAMRGDLAAVRAHAWGGIADLSILMILSNPLANNLVNANNRNNLWIERLREVYEDAAVDFRCAIYDPFVEAGWGQGEEGLSLDEYATHPRVNLNMDIWGRALTETCLPFAVTRRNGFSLRAYAEGVAPPMSAGLALYDPGLSVLRAEAADGWDYTGMLTTMRHPDDIGTQRLESWTSTYTRTLERQWMPGSTSWSAWDRGVADLVLGTNIVAYGGSLGVPRARRMPGSLIVLSGVAKSTATTGAITGGTVIATLPPGFRPAANEYIHGVRYEAGDPTKLAPLIYITTAGEIQAIRDVDGDFIGFGGIVFPLA